MPAGNMHHQNMHRGMDEVCCNYRHSFLSTIRVSYLAT
jgi:hypothetical protein